MTSSKTFHFLCYAIVVPPPHATSIVTSVEINPVIIQTKLSIIPMI
jgi:hypothetical protein